MSTAPEILLLEGIHAEAEALLQAAGIRVRRRAGSLAGAALRDAIGDASFVGIRSRSGLDAVALEAPGLAAVGCFCIGINQVDLDAARRVGTPVFNAPFSNTRSVAELTVAEVIALHRRLAEKSSGLHRGKWDKSTTHAHEVRGRTLGIVGYGHIGSQVSVLAESLGLRVVYHDIVPRLPLGNAQPLESLDALLAAADVVTLHVPATPRTECMIGAAQLERMRSGAYLINNARGSIVDLDALADALRAGRIAGAALDVFPQEPSAAQAEFACALSGLPNVILTPHIGGSTAEAQEAIAREVADKLVAYALRGTTTGAVNVPTVDLPRLNPERPRIAHFHHNVPGVLSSIHAKFAELGINIHGEILQSDAEISYCVMDVAPGHADQVLTHLESVPETVRVRVM